MTTDLTTGEVQFELLTDFRTPPPTLVDILTDSFRIRVENNLGILEAESCLINTLMEL